MSCLTTYNCLWTNRINAIDMALNSGLAHQMYRNRGVIDRKYLLKEYGIKPPVWWRPSRPDRTNDWWEYGVWNPAYISGLQASGSLRMDAPGKRHGWSIQNHPALHEDILQMSSAYDAQMYAPGGAPKCSLSAATRPNSSSTYRFTCEHWHDGLDPSNTHKYIDKVEYMAGLMAGGRLHPEDGQEWIYIREGEAARAALARWTIPCRSVRRAGHRYGALQVSPFYGALMIGWMGLACGFRITGVKRAGGCPLIPWIYWDLLEGCGGGGWSLPWNSGTRYFYEEGPGRKNLHRLGVEMGIVGLHKPLEGLMRRWISTWKAFGREVHDDEALLEL